MAFPGAFLRGDAFGGRQKKLLAGVRFSLSQSAPGATEYDCASCTERQRDQRNCYNRQQLASDIAIGADEWRTIPADLRPVLKLGDVKFYRCPLAVITTDTWALIDLVNECLDTDGNLVQLPYPGPVTEQPASFREAAKIIRRERAAWRREQLDKERK